MSDYIDNLRQALREAAAREYPPTPHPATNKTRLSAAVNGQAPRTGWRVRARWRWSPLAVVAAVLLGGGSAAAIAGLLASRSAPLTGAVPGTTAPLRYDIPVTPDLEPGDAGWCSYPIFSIIGRIDDAAGGTCSPAVPPGAPVILGGAEPLSNEQALLRQTDHQLGVGQPQLNLFWMMVSPRVEAVRIDAHQIVASRADPRLPPGWRAIVAFTSVPLGRLQPVALDRYGHPIADHTAPSTRLIPGSGGVSTVRSYAPGSNSPTPCSIARLRVAGVTAQWEVVATTTPALGPAVLPGTLFSCARSWFSIKGQSRAPSAAILLDAQDPRRPAPPPPGLNPATLRGIYINPTAEIVAKRVGRAWLVVQSQSPALGERLLNTLRVTGGSATPSAKRQR